MVSLLQQKSTPGATGFCCRQFLFVLADGVLLLCRSVFCFYVLLFRFFAFWGGGFSAVRYIMFVFCAVHQVGAATVFWGGFYSKAS